MSVDLRPVDGSSKQAGRSGIGPAASTSPARIPKRIGQHSNESQDSDAMRSVPIAAAASPSDGSRDQRQGDLDPAGGTVDNKEMARKSKDRSGSKKRRVTSSSGIRLEPKSSLTVSTLTLENGIYQTVSQVLASESNYQCLEKGNHSQLGLSYPDQVLANLISKRTCHTVAERNRRKRLTNALQEMAVLLSQGSYGDWAGHNSSTNSSAGSQMTKAGTVELAIEYIKILRKELVEKKSTGGEMPTADATETGVPTTKPAVTLLRTSEN